jgi:hypothetical protein
MVVETSTKDFAAAIKVLSQMPNVIARIMKQFKDLERVKLSNDTFSILEHACHLRDLEKEGYLIRIKKILAQTNPFLANFEGDKIALERDYNNQNPQIALDDFKSARQESIERLKSLTPEHLKRTGELEAVGTINLEDLMRLMLEHDKSHLEELEELAEKLSEKTKTLVDGVSR